MIRHPEQVLNVGDVQLTLTGEYHTLEVEVTTAGNIRKLLKIRESDAAELCAALADALDERPEEGRLERYNASVRAGR